MLKRIISLFLYTVFTIQHVFADGHLSIPTDTKQPITSNEVPASVVSQQNAIEITMPDGSKKIGAIFDGKFIPLEP